MNRLLFSSTLVTLSLAVGAVLGQAQSAATSVTLPPAAPAAKAPPPPPSAIEDWIKEAKSPLSWFTWGADLRIRDEYYNNIVSLTDASTINEQNVIRFRSRVWSTITPVTNVTMNVRLASETREWTRPAFASQYRGQQGMEWRYGIFDNLNVKWNNAFDQPLNLSAGRQDIAIGDYWNWWLVADGTPLDGSWTYFLDSMRATYEAKQLKTKFDLIYIYQNARPDEWVPTLNAGQSSPGEPEYALTEQNEQGVIAYISNKSIKNTSLDGFFIYKRDDQELANGDNANIYTVGGRISGLPADHWQYSLEGAYQFGEKQDPTIRTGTINRERDIDAIGANGRLSYLFRDPLNNQLHLIGEYLSGDDNSTDGKDEMFDILWGRWPRYSELYIYSFAAETGGRFAQHNNIYRLGGGWTFNPTKNTLAGAYYNAFFAPQELPTRAGAALPLFSQDGNFRGHYVQGVLQHTFSKHVKAHLWAEFVWQGDFYTDDELMSFLRAEVNFTF